MNFEVGIDAQPEGANTRAVVGAVERYARLRTSELLPGLAGVSSLGGSGGGLPE